MSFCTICEKHIPTSLIDKHALVEHGYKQPILTWSSLNKEHRQPKLVKQVTNKYAGTCGTGPTLVSKHKHVLALHAMIDVANSSAERQPSVRGIALDTPHLDAMNERLTLLSAADPVLPQGPCQ